MIAAFSWSQWRGGATSPDGDEPAPSSSHDDKFLPLADRKYVWDIEHLAFLMEQNVFPKLKDVLVSPDAAGWGEFLSPSFSGEIPGKSPQEKHDAGTFQHRRSQRTATNTTTVNAAGLMAFWKELRSRFSADKQACSASIGIVRISPQTHGEFGGAWTSRWKIRLAGRRGDALVEVKVMMSLVLTELTEQLADRKHWIQSVSVDDVQILEAAGPLMRDITQVSGIKVSALHDNWEGDEFRPNTGGVYLNDYNDDGILDVLIDDCKAGIILYRGLGAGKFADVTAAAGLRRPSDKPPLWVVSCWGDFDGDGDEDLIAADLVYENLGNGTFRDITAKTKLPLTPAAGYSVADFDGDGKLDLYVCHSGAYRPGQTVAQRVAWIDGSLGVDNVLLRNMGNWTFSDVTEETGTGGGGASCFAAVWLDVNGDLRPDLFALNEFGRNSLLIQQKNGKFAESRVDPIFGGFSMGVTAGDLDNDGRDDLYVSNMYSKAGNRILSNVDAKRYGATLHRKIQEATTGNKLYCSQGNGNFDSLPPEQIVAAVGWAYGPNFVDLNMDGLLDLYVPAGFKSTQRGKPDG